MAAPSVLSATPSPFALAAPGLVAAGYSVIPIKPGAKAPIPPGWQRYAEAPASAAQIATWSSAPDNGIGICLGSRVSEYIVIALDFDAPDGDALDALLSAAPHSPMVKRGRKGETRFFRSDPGVRTKHYAGLLDVLAAGSQTVVPPSRHPSGVDYQWLGRIVAAAGLPILTADDLARLMDTVAHIKGVDVAEIEEDASAPAAEPREDLDATTATYRDLNQRALDNLEAWVPQLGLYDLRRKAGGYEAVATWRASSTGKPLEQRARHLSITRHGIKDFGTDDRYTAVDLTMASTGRSFDDAFSFLYERVGETEAEILHFKSLSEKMEEKRLARLAERDQAEAYEVIEGLARDVAGVLYNPETGEIIAESNARHQAPSPITWDDRDANASGAQSWLVKGLLPDRGVSLLFGQSGAGKSFISLELAACVMDGSDFFGHRVKATGGVLFAMGEGGAAMPDRLNAIRVGRFGGAAPVNPETGKPMDINRLPIAWMNVADLAQPRRFAEFAGNVRAAAANMRARHGCELRSLIIDTCVAAFGFADDPDAAEVTRMMTALDALAQELRILILPLHHAGKSREAAEHGSYAWRASAETSLMVDADRNALTGEVGTRRLIVRKNRHAANEGWNAVFDLRSVELAIDDDGDAISSAVVIPGTGGDASASRAPSPADTLRREFFASYARLSEAAELERDPEFGDVRKVRLDTIKDDLRGRGFLDVNERGALTPTARTRLARLRDELLAPDGGWAMRHDLIFMLNI